MGAPTGDQTCNPGTCSDWESNWQPFALQDDAKPIEPHWSGLMVCYEAVGYQISPIIFPFPAQDEVFEFPGVTAGHQDLDSRAITLVTGSSRKISVRLQRATTSQATQTEPVWSEAGWGDSGSHTFPKMRSKFHDKAAKDKGFAKWENEKPRVQAGVDVVDRGTEFDSDQDEADMGETRQDGEVSAGSNHK